MDWLGQNWFVVFVTAVAAFFGGREVIRGIRGVRDDRRKLRPLDAIRYDAEKRRIKAEQDAKRDKIKNRYRSERDDFDRSMQD